MQNLNKHTISFGIRELLSMGKRLGEKLKDKYIWTHEEIEEAIGYLIYLKDKLRKENPIMYSKVFGESGDFFEIRHFKKGFNSNLITFKTIVHETVNKWVLKVGHRLSVVVDFGDPSSEAYYQEYKDHLEVVRKKILQEKKLQHLLPEPQEVMWAVLTQEGKRDGRTLIIQPYLHIVKKQRIKKKLTEEQRKILLDELHAFKRLCEILLKDYEIEPDLLGEGNLEVTEKDGQYHLMLLDSGFVNLKAPLPITHTFMHFAKMQTIANVENLIRKIL